MWNACNEMSNSAWGEFCKMYVAWDFRNKLFRLECHWKCPSPFMLSLYIDSKEERKIKLNYALPLPQLLPHRARGSSFIFVRVSRHTNKCMMANIYILAKPETTVDDIQSTILFYPRRKRTKHTHAETIRLHYKSHLGVGGRGRQAAWRRARLCVNTQTHTPVSCIIGATMVAAERILEGGDTAAELARFAPHSIIPIIIL